MSYYANVNGTLTIKSVGNVVKLCEKLIEEYKLQNNFKTNIMNPSYPTDNEVDNLFDTLLGILSYISDLDIYDNAYLPKSDSYEFTITRIIRDGRIV